MPASATTDPRHANDASNGGVFVLGELLQCTDAELAQLEQLWQQQNDGLIAAFGNAMRALDCSGAAGAQLARQHLHQAIVSLQMQDMAAQVLRQARERLQGCVRSLHDGRARQPAALVNVTESIGAPPLRMQLDSAGSIELFDNATQAGHGDAE